MRRHQHMEKSSAVVAIALFAVLLAFMGLSLAITATGTARFAVAIGYRAEVGYAVGVVFDFAKALLPVALLMLFRRGAFVVFGLIGFAWLGLVIYSCLATHATVSTAIADIERTGTWKMEGRANTKTELADVEGQIAALSNHGIPRPSKTVQEALAVERVPPAIWRESRECQAIRQSKYFQAACTKVLDLRRELAAAGDYEQLNARAKELRRSLSATQVVAVTDPLPEAFDATLGRVLPLEGRAGVALLATLVIEILGCFGLVAMRLLREDKGREDRADEKLQRPLLSDRRDILGTVETAPDRAIETTSERPSEIVPRSSLSAANTGRTTSTMSASDDHAEHPSSPITAPKFTGRKCADREATRPSARSAGGGIVKIASHVPEFARDCLKLAVGPSLSAAELRDAYEAWCEARGEEPVSGQKLGAELTALGFRKWKSCGLIRYRDLQLGAETRGVYSCSVDLDPVIPLQP